MGKYVVLYYAPKSAGEAMSAATPEDMKKGMELWMTWAERCGEGLVDIGAPLGGGRKVTKSGTTPSDKDVTGYSVLQAENMEAAQALLTDHPHLGWEAGCEIEIHEAIPLPC